MALFAISDTHLSLAVNKPMDKFGNRWKCYTEKLVEGWRTLVGPQDTVVVAGDVSWGMTLEEALPDLRLLDSLPGIKWLGRGNHDYWWDTVTKMERTLDEAGLKSIRFLYNCARYAEGVWLCGSRGWFTDRESAPQGTDYDKILAREATRIELSVADARKQADQMELAPPDAQNTLCFLHFPPVFRGTVCRPILDALHRCGIRRCYYGHIHGAYDQPSSFVFEDITFTITSADYLHFYPLQISTDLSAPSETVKLRSEGEK